MLFKFCFTQAHNIKKMMDIIIKKKKAHFADVEILIFNLLYLVDVEIL